MRLAEIDQYLSSSIPSEATGWRRFVLEFLMFGLKEARCCLFAGLFFAAVFLMPRAGLFGIPRYDALLLFALLVQVWMVSTRIETIAELKAISVFHVVGFALEVFKTSGAIQSWSYPDFAYTKLFGVPLFSGFMYAAVGSYIIQAWRLFDLRIQHHPPYWMATLIALLIYVNFFTHHYIGDYRWYLAACALGLYARSTVLFRPLDRDRKMPLLLAFLLIGFFIWLAENIGSFGRAWIYPAQREGFAMVSPAKLGAWYLLMIVSFVLVSLVHRPVLLRRDKPAAAKTAGALPSALAD